MHCTFSQQIEHKVIEICSLLVSVYKDFYL